MDPADARKLLDTGELELTGRLVVASNATFVGTLRRYGLESSCVYKPIRGERPLWDFPHGTLAGREVASYRISSAAGWDLVPPTLLRDGPLGEGMCQLWIDSADEEDPSAEVIDVVPPDEVPQGWLRVLDAIDGEGDPITLVHADDPRLRRLAVFDVVVNNADRKGGHILVDPWGHLYGVDHGVTLHEEDKLRTVLWGWAGLPLPEECQEGLDRIERGLDGALGAELAPLLERVEIAALRDRIGSLRRSGRHPEPGEGWPSVPWPVF